MLAERYNSLGSSLDVKEALDSLAVTEDDLFRCCELPWEFICFCIEP